MKIAAFFLTFFVFESLAFATHPPCLKMSEVVSVNNSEILRLKQTAQDHQAFPALVRGTLVKMYSADGPTTRFQMKMGPRPSDVIEVNSMATNLPALRAGDRILACARFMSLRGESPDGALLYETSQTWKPTGDDGYLIINGVLYDQL